MSTKAYYPRAEIGPGQVGFSKTRSIIEAPFYGNNVIKVNTLKEAYELAKNSPGTVVTDMPVYRGDRQIGWVTSGTMVPYYQFNGDGPEATPTDATGKRSIGFAYISSAITKDDTVEIDVRGKRLKAKLTTRHIRQDLPPYVRPVL